MSPGYSAVQTARLVSALRWACGRLSDIVDAWATEAAAAAEGAQAQDGSADAGAADAAAAVEMVVLSRRLASHRSVLDGLQPDSERLASWRQAAPADASLAAALDEIAALEGALEQLAVARDVLVPQLLGAYQEIGAHAAPHCDGALAAAASSLGHDLGRGGYRTAEPADALPTGAAEAAKRGLSTAGGLVGRSLLCPAGWG